MEKLAALLGGAAGGAARGLPTTFTGSVIGGAGAGAQRAVGQLNQEMRERQQRFETQRQVHLRTHTAMMAQAKVAEQQASVANAQLESSAAGMRQRAQIAENAASIQQAQIEAGVGMQNAALQLRRDLLAHEQLKPQLVNTRTGLQVVTFDPATGDAIVHETPDSAFLKALLQFEALAELTDAAGMGQESIMVGFEELSLDAFAPEQRPALILAAAMLMNPGAASLNIGGQQRNLVEWATANAVTRKPEFEMLLETVNTPAANEDLYNRFQAEILKELMVLMNDDDVYRFALASYGGVGLPQQLFQQQGLAEALGGGF
jgi:hypothetical protein